MSIVSYHARVGESLLDALQTNPDLFWALPHDAGPAEAELLYIDKDWRALSWLLSAKAREEQKHEVAFFALTRRPDSDDLDKAAWDAAKAREASKLGFELVDTESMPDDPALIAIEGRGPEDERLADIGLGGRAFVPTEVASLAAALDRIPAADMREHFDPQVMEDLDVAGMMWTQDDPDVLDAILIPIFDRLKAFYADAARAGQYVLVVHS